MTKSTAIIMRITIVDNNLVKRWTEYVKNGGHLILTCRTGQKDRDAKLWEAPLAAVSYTHLPNRQVHVLK